MFSLYYENNWVCLICIATSSHGTYIPSKLPLATVTCKKLTCVEEWEWTFPRFRLSHHMCLWCWGIKLFWVFQLVNLTDTAVLERKDMEYLVFYSKNGVRIQTMMNEWLYEVQESSYLVFENSSQVRYNSLRSTSFKNISQMITIPQSWTYPEPGAKADYNQYLGM